MEAKKLVNIKKISVLIVLALLIATTCGACIRFGNPDNSYKNDIYYKRVSRISWTGQSPIVAGVLAQPDSRIVWVSSSGSKPTAPPSKPTVASVSVNYYDLNYSLLDNYRLLKVEYSNILAYYDWVGTDWILSQDETRYEYVWNANEISRQSDTYFITVYNPEGLTTQEIT
ncbi:MAG: hypothetical protein FWF56_04360 [Firmicutes bacterium]|nr:hypothetical protein [Bacillota bacterium]MCL1954207.1 hypothetical protein [Bacillota bacterium]